MAFPNYWSLADLNEAAGAADAFACAEPAFAAAGVVWDAEKEDSL